MQFDCKFLIEILMDVFLFFYANGIQYFEFVHILSWDISLQVLLYPEEGWARSATSSYIMIKLCPWWRNLCIVEEIAGTRQ